MAYWENLDCNDQSDKNKKKQKDIGQIQIQSHFGSFRNYVFSDQYNHESTTY